MVRGQVINELYLRNILCNVVHAENFQLEATLFSCLTNPIDAQLIHDIANMVPPQPDQPGKVFPLHVSIPPFWDFFPIDQAIFNLPLSPENVLG